jgi:hypothetical protein
MKVKGYMHPQMKKPVGMLYNQMSDIGSSEPLCEYKL